MARKTHSASPSADEARRKKTVKESSPPGNEPSKTVHASPDPHASLRVSEEFLSSAFAGVEAAITVSEVLDGGREFRFLSANRACVEWTGIPLEEWIGRRPQDILPPEDAAAICARYAQAVEGGQRITYEEFLTFPSRSMWALTTVTPQRDANGTINRLVATAVEITTQKRTEETLRQLNETLEQRVAERTAALQVSEENYRLLAENSADFVALHEAGGRCVYRSPSFYRITGWSEADLDPAKAFSRVHPDDLPVVQQAQKSVEEGKASVVESRYRCKDGRWLWLETRRTPIPGADGRLARIVLTSHDITERKEAEEALRMRESELRAAFDNFPFDFWIRDKNGVCIMQNSVSVKNWGGNLGNRTEQTKISAETLKLWLENNRRAFAGEVVRGDVEILHDGATRHLHNIVAPIRVGKEVRGILGFNIDITERKRAEAALKVSELKYRRLYESITDAVVTVSMSGQIREFNPAYSKMLGYSGEELLQLKYEDVTPEKWHDCESAIVRQQVLRRGFSDVYQKEYRRKDGTIFPVELRTLLIKDEAGRPTGMWAIIRDITKRRRAEEALRESEERLAVLVKTAPAGIAIHGSDGRLLSVNDTGRKLLGITKANAKGKGLSDPAWQFVRADGSRMPMSEFPVAIVLARKAPLRSYICGIEHGGRHAVTWVWVNAMPLLAENGSVAEVVVAFMDITERKQAEAALRQLNETLEQRVAERGAKLSAANVELKREIAGRKRLEQRIVEIAEQERRRFGLELHDDICQRLAGAAMMSRSLSADLRTADPATAARVQSISTILKETLRTTRELARGLHPGEFDSVGLVSELRALAAQTTLSVPCKLQCPRAVSIPGKDAALQLFRIAQEAVSNALKHAGARTIVIDLQKRRAGISLTVADDGKGLSEKPGDGLGMRSMMHRAQMIGAKFQLKRNPGGGTRVVCILPVHR